MDKTVYLLMAEEIYLRTSLVIGFLSASLYLPSETRSSLLILKKYYRAMIMGLLPAITLLQRKRGWKE